MHPTNQHSRAQTNCIMDKSTIILPLALIPKISHPALHHNPQKRTAPLWEPAVEVYEDESQFVVRTELPGIDPEIIDIEIEEKSLLIKSMKTSWDRSFSRTNHDSTAFTRLISLPAHLVVESAEYHHENGVLTVYLPKSSPSTMKPITIQFEN